MSTASAAHGFAVVQIATKDPRRAVVQIPISTSLPPFFYNMTDSFRKIDIDAYDEDVLLESDLVDPDPRDPATVLADVKGKNAQIRGFLSKCV